MILRSEVKARRSNGFDRWKRLKRRREHNHHHCRGEKPRQFHNPKHFHTIEERRHARGSRGTVLLIGFALAPDPLPPNRTWTSHKNMLGGLDSLPPEDQQKMNAMIEQLQIRDSLRMYISVVERYFTDCVDTFRRKTLDKQEDTCVHRCAEKFLKHSMRVSMRFAELSLGAATQD